MATKSLAAQSWAAAFALALHNAEEILLGLPAWGRAHPAFNMSLWSDSAFAAVAVGLALAAMLFALWCQLRPHRLQGSVLRLFALVMLINAGSHLVLSIVSTSLMPGTVTAVLLILPVFGWIFFRPAR